MSNTVNIHIDGVPIFGDVHGKLDLILARITALEASMSALSDALSAAAARIADDFANMQRLLNEALATETAAVAERDALLAQAAEVQADVDATVAALNAIDPDPTNPPVEPPVEP